MKLSGNQIKSLGKRLKKGDHTDEDIILLEEFRASYDPILINYGMEINAALNSSCRPFLIAGRSKRTKSIIRKIRRQDLNRH